MSSPRYRPRDWIVSSRQFGKDVSALWKQPPEAATSREKGRLIAERGAAFLQHTLAHKIRSSLREQKMTIGEYAEDIGVDGDRLERMLRGEVIMRLEDIAMAEYVFGGVEVTFDWLSKLPEQH